MFIKCISMVVFIAFLISLIPSYCLSQENQSQDKVYLKNGDIIQGVIVEQTQGENIKIQIADGSILVYPMSDVERISKDQPEAVVSSAPIKSKKQPAVACVLSIIIPGLGQFYNGEVGKGAIMLGTVIVGLSLMGVGLEQEFDWNSNSDGEAMIAMGICVGAVGWLWSIVDAPVSASEINRKNGWTALWLTDDVSVRLAEYSIDGKPAPGIKLKWSF